MGSTPEEQIQEEIKKAQSWYGQKYKKTFEVHQRYDKVEKHFSWRLVTNIGGEDRILPFGISVKTMESPQFPAIRAKVFDHIKQSLIKGQTRWEPMILGLK